MFTPCEPREHDLGQPFCLVAVTDGPSARASAKARQTHLSRTCIYFTAGVNLKNRAGLQQKIFRELPQSRFGDAKLGADLIAGDGG